MQEELFSGLVSQPPHVQRLKATMSNAPTPQQTPLKTNSTQNTNSDDTPAARKRLAMIQDALSRPSGSRENVLFTKKPTQLALSQSTQRSQMEPPLDLSPSSPFGSPIRSFSPPKPKQESWEEIDDDLFFTIAASQISDTPSTPSRKGKGVEIPPDSRSPKRPRPINWNDDDADDRSSTVSSTPGSSQTTGSQLSGFRFGSLASISARQSPTSQQIHANEVRRGCSPFFDVDLT